MLTYDDADAAISWLADAFGFVPGEVTRDDGGRIVHATLTWANGMVMLSQSRGAGSPFADWLAKNGEGLHHISYEVKDIAGELKKLAELGVNLQDKEPREIPGGMKIAFVGPEGSSGVVIELVERPD